MRFKIEPNDSPALVRLGHLMVLRHLWYTIITKMSYTKEHSDVQNELNNICTRMVCGGRSWSAG